MELSISWWAVVAATAIGMAIAWPWYADWGLFGSTWRQLTGVTKEDSDRVGKRPVVILVACLVVTALGLAAASAIAVGFFGSDSIWLHLAVGAGAWLCFSLSTLAQHNGFENKPDRLTGINSAYQLVLFVGMALVIGLVQ